MIKQIYHIAVCDDELADRKQIESMTAKICREERMDAEISLFASAEELTDKLKFGTQYDLLLIDVMMPKQNGMELARQLRTEKIKASIVFISNNKEMALQGYEVEAARYLAKPLKEELLREAIVFCYRQRQIEREILLPVNGSVRKVSPKDICYIEICGRKSRVMQEKETWDTSLPIRKLEEMLSNQGFIRCHQSFLVNCRYVRVFHTSSMELSDGRNIPVSKHRIKEVRQAFFDYMRY